MMSRRSRRFSLLHQRTTAATCRLPSNPTRASTPQEKTRLMHDALRVPLSRERLNFSKKPSTKTNAWHDGGVDRHTQTTHHRKRLRAGAIRDLQRDCLAATLAQGRRSRHRLALVGACYSPFNLFSWPNICCSTTGRLDMRLDWLHEDKLWCS